MGAQPKTSEMAKPVSAECTCRCPGRFSIFQTPGKSIAGLVVAEPFGCDHFTASGQDAHRDALGELNYTVQLRCEDAGSLLKASVSLIESARPLQL